ncbi:hypothetical protein FXO38_25855 [Capsicum annuum]|nr:hypothetical protein FXO38_25855 [Capsicum annuum]KAF3649322.1 hypothetical protein FXO37_19030 [Capsicum annuum]
MQTLSDPKVIDGIKMELFGATTITRKTNLEGGANDAPLTVFETTNHYDYDHNGCIDFSPDFAASSECSLCKCQDRKTKNDGVINTINALTASVKEMISKRGVIPSKRISYPDTPLDIKASKRRRKDTSKASSIIKKARLQRLYLCLTPMFRVDITATAEEHNMTVDNPSTASKNKEKVEPVILRERKNYSFERFNISDKALKKLTQLINNYSEWIVDGLLKHHADRKQNDERYKVNESSLGFNRFDFVVAHPKMKNCFYLMSQSQTCWNGFNIPVGLPWHLVDEVYIPINCGVEFHWVLAVVILKERHIRVYDSVSRRRHFRPSSKIQKLAKILTTYLDMSSFLDQKFYFTNFTTLARTARYAEYLSDGLQVPNDGLDAGLLRKKYAALLWKYGEAKAQKLYATDVKDPRRPKPNSVALNEEQLVHID